MSLRQLREKLDKGFYVDNLHEMARLCKGMALESNSPAPFFIMQKIFLGIADYWEDKPVIVEEAKLVEAELKKSLIQIIDAIEADASDAHIMDLANKAVSSYLFLYR